ncbi:hypothetical protein HG536_0E01270 [Torulaspora globosa]|uniref:Mitochondrial inner membrane protein COX18 n=1 Tax=Torulaspora globosa TaxID=48254 RepID=A0A7G3ZI80_9SACH|nr:uncharacterized protein HG536_0E01270 [Torulaspora globosa]QLL33216.1 hypothetical protein HG536_0E01270 [Torulaspora globosa]
MVVMLIHRIGPRVSIRECLAGNSLGTSISKRKISVFQGVSETLIHIHSASSLPWVVLIPLGTILLRTVTTLPLSVWQRKRIVKQQELRKLVQAIPPVTKLRLAASTASRSENSITSSGSATGELPNGGSTARSRTLTPEQITLLAVKETRKRQKRLFAKYNVQMWKNAVLPLVQMPLWVTLSMGIRSLTEKRLLETNTGQLLNSIVPPTLDLSLPLEPLPMLVPLILGSLALINVEYNGKALSSTRASNAGIVLATDEHSRAAQGMASILNISRFGCIFMMGISSQAPLLLSLYWISSQLYSFTQNLILNWLWPYER